MIRNSKQAWEIGETVKVGFMQLRVLAKVATPGNYLPYDTSDDLAAAKKLLETVERMIADDDPEAASQHCGTLAHAVNALHNAILRSWEDRDAGPSDEAVARAADYRERVRDVVGTLKRGEIV